MTIKYFRLNEYGEICRYEIDTIDRDYVSHTDESVTIHDGYSDSTYPLKFEDIKNQLIDHIKDQLADAEKLTEDSIDFP
jgi:hypothetical protein